MDHRRQLLLGVAEPFEQALHAAELEIDDLRMQLVQALQHDVAGTALGAAIGSLGRRVHGRDLVHGRYR